MAILVQRGTKTLSNGSASMTIVQGTDAGFDTTVTKAQTRLRFTYRTAGTSVNTYTNYSLAATLTDGNTITVTRSGTDADVIVEWELTQFDASQLVAQYVTLTFTATTTATASISAASLGGGRWVEYLGMVTAQENASRSTCNIVFNSTTEVGATRASGTGTVTAYAVVYEHVEATVQTVTQTLTTNTETDHDETITSVDTAKSFVVGTARTQNFGIAAASWQCHLTSATNLRWSRSLGTSSDVTITSFVVSLADTTAVQRFTVTHGDGTANPVNTTITAVTTASTSLTLGGMMVIALGLSSSTSAFGRALSTVELTSTTNVAEQKGITATALTQYAQVIQWGAFSGGGGENETLAFDSSGFGTNFLDVPTFRV